MSRSSEQRPLVIDLIAARLLVVQQPHWLPVNGEARPAFILRVEELTGYLSSEPGEEIELTALPVARKDVTRVFLQATIK